jgi:hypothetical protein
VTGKPLWLASSDVAALLNLLVDRLDGADQRGSKAQSIALTEKTWPALYRAEFESRKEELWEHLVDMARWGWLQVKPDAALRSTSGYAQQPRVTVADEAAVRASVNRPERIRSSVERWREAVNAGLMASHDVKRAAGDYCIDMPDRTMADVGGRLNVLAEFRDSPMLLREVSTRLFWGMSKVLDNRQGLVAALLGVDECPFPESPIQLQVYLPSAGYHGVLFIENLMTYEQALRSTTTVFSGLALVYASGFKGSAQRLRTSTGCSLFHSSKGALGGEPSTSFERWLFDRAASARPVHFWGDLDHAGMRILAAMRSSFPGLTAWEPGYAPMLAGLLDGKGHSPEAAEKAGQRPVSSTGCSFADTKLIPALAAHGQYLDQEMISL